MSLTPEAERLRRRLLDPWLFRAYLVRRLPLAAFAGLGYRLVDLQVLRHQDLSAKAEQNTHSEFLLEPRRGDILDTRGNLVYAYVGVTTTDRPSIKAVLAQLDKAP